MILLARPRPPFASSVPLAALARRAPLAAPAMVALSAAFALLLLLPAGLAAQAGDSTVAHLERRIDAIQAQLDSLRAELHALVTTTAAVTPAPTPAPTTGTFIPGPRTKTSGCVAHQPLPDAACTPGVIMTSNMDTICNTTTRGRRDVTPEMEREAYAAYAVSYPQPRGSIELDHLISLELGGDNAVANLWPQFADPKPGFHEKDLVENELHKRVCSGQMTLDQARRIIATDWLDWYNNNMVH